MSSPGACQANPDKAQAINVECLDSLLDTLRAPKSAKRKNGLMIALSTDQVYPGTNAPYKETDLEVTDQHDRKSTNEPCNVYGKTKVEMEQRCRNSQNQNPENSQPIVVVLRSSILLGPKVPFVPENTHSTFLHFCHSRLLPERIPTTYWTNERRSVIAVQNAIDVICYFIRQYTMHEDVESSLPHGVYNMGGLESVSRYDMALAVAKHTILRDEYRDIDKYVIGQEKDTIPSGSFPTPLDITMDMNKLLQLNTGIHFLSLSEMVTASKLS